MRSPPSVSRGGRRGSRLLVVKAEVTKLCRGTPPFWSPPGAGAVGLGGAGVQEAAGDGCGWWCLGPRAVQGEGSHLAGRVDAVCGARTFIKLLFPHPFSGFVSPEMFISRSPVAPRQRGAWLQRGLPPSSCSSCSFPGVWWRRGARCQLRTAESGQPRPARGGQLRRGARARAKVSRAVRGAGTGPRPKVSISSLSCPVCPPDLVGFLLPSLCPS